MKSVIFAVALCAFVSIVSSQLISAAFSLLSGSTSAAPTPFYYPSTYGGYDPNSTPGWRVGHKIIVYKGLIYTFHGNPGFRADVWTFNPSDKAWSWIAGVSNNGNNENPSWGVLGVMSPTNHPGYRNQFASDLDLTRDQYVLYGGRTTRSGQHSSLWIFDLSRFMWTWKSGSKLNLEPPNYNVQGISTNFTTPGGRNGSPAFINESTGEFILFGGSNDTVAYGDLWSFDLVSARWTWISGSSIPDDGGSITSQGNWSSLHNPSARTNALFVRNPTTNVVYMFGGLALAESTWLNDMWALKWETREWAWVSGTLQTNRTPMTGTKGVPSALNYPGGLYSYSASFHKASGLILIYGGSAIDKSVLSGRSNDLWAYNSTSNEWTWVFGSVTRNTAGVYDVGGVKPPSAFLHSMAVDQQNGNIYVFGGEGYVNIAFPNSRVNLDHVWLISLTYFGKSDPSSAYTKIVQANDTLLTTSSQKHDATENNLRSASGIISFALSLTPAVRYIAVGAIGTSILAILIVFTRCLRTRWALKANTSVMSKDRQETEDQPTASSISFNTSMTSSNEQTTVASTTMGLYLPGGLQVQAARSYRCEKVIAQGGCADIWLATAFDAGLLAYGSTVVVKIPNSKLENERDLDLFNQEIALMNAFKNEPNIVKLLGYSDNPHATILKYYPRGSLAKWISSHFRTLKQTFEFTKGISAGLSALHKNGVAHCDLKPDNILVDEGPLLKAVISDFGIARIVTDKLLTVTAYRVQLINGASVAYASPEALKELRNVTKTKQPTVNEAMSRDTYALGLIIGAMLNGYPAWNQ
eukprot:Partr_v1_DN27581_c0_g1_i2_m30721 putative Inherit from NOG: hedgehog protein